MSAPGKCLNPNCTRQEKHRGLCASCYQAACHLVWVKKTTWATLEESGRCKPSSQIRTTAKPTSWLLSTPESQPKEQ